MGDKMSLYITDQGQMFMGPGVANSSLVNPMTYQVLKAGASAGDGYLGVLLLDLSKFTPLL